MGGIVIVGGGIAGLSAGVYARYCGYDVTIYEMHTIPGGNSTSWKREGYLFEGGMHWLTGSNADLPLNKLWRQVGALGDDVQVSYKDPFLTYIDRAEKQICLYRDVRRLQSHFMEVSPQDAAAIQTLCKDISKFSGVSMPIMDLKKLKTEERSPSSMGILKAMLPLMGRMGHLNNISVNEYVDAFVHEGIRTLLKSVVPPSYNASSLIFTLGCLASMDGGYPAGGSLQMAERMAEHFKSLGGKIEFGKKVERVLLEGNKATGVVVDGAALYFDGVIVTVDTLAAIDTLFRMPLREPWMDVMRKRTKLAMCTFFSLGVRTDLSDYPESFVFDLEVPFVYANMKVAALGIYNYARYEDYAPKGCTALTIPLMGDTYDYWKNAYADGSYNKKKLVLAEHVIKAVSDKIPAIKGKVAVSDVATPLTYERYTGSFHGSWMSVTEKGSKQVSYPGKSQSINRLYFAGQRLQPPGGLPVALDTGRTAVQHLCVDDGRVFKARGV